MLPHQLFKLLAADAQRLGPVAHLPLFGEADTARILGRALLQIVGRVRLLAILPLFKNRFEGGKVQSGAFRFRPESRPCAPSDVAAKFDSVTPTRQMPFGTGSTERIKPSGLLERGAALERLGKRAASGRLLEVGLFDLHGDGPTASFSLQPVLLAVMWR
jgi:hypothetical protein